MDMFSCVEAVAFPNKKYNNNNKKKMESFRLCRNFKIMLKVMTKLCLRFQEFLV